MKILEKQQINNEMIEQCVDQEDAAIEVDNINKSKTPSENAVQNSQIDIVEIERILSNDQEFNNQDYANQKCTFDQ